MATPAQTAANRENAKRPRTLSEETKESLRSRAVKHGLTSKVDTNIVLKDESKTEYQTMLSALLSEATLGSAQEILLIKLQAESYWKLQRANRMEAGALDASLIAAQIQGDVPKGPIEEEDLGASLAFALKEQAQWFDKLRRYASAAERSFYRATRELAMIRKAGLQDTIGYVPPEPTALEPKIGCDLKTVLPGHQPDPRLHGMSPRQLVNNLENMSEAEAFALLDEITAPPVIRG